MKSEVKSIVICGVGGQGVLKASEIVSDVILASGFFVKKSEVHGMAQRGGSVVSFVRYSNTVKDFSPLVPEQSADLLVAFETLESLRYARFLTKTGVALVNDVSIFPSGVLLGELNYPEVKKSISEFCDNAFFIPAYDFACSLGNPRFSNVFMLGVLSKFLPFEPSLWEKSIVKNLKRYNEENLMAFRKGRSYELPLIEQISLEEKQ